MISWFMGSSPATTWGTGVMEVIEVMEVVEMVEVMGAMAHLLQVGLHVLQLLVEALEAHELAGDALAEGAHRGVLHVPQQVLHPHLLRLLRAYLGGHVLEGLVGRRAVVMDLLDHLEGQGELRQGGQAPYRPRWAARSWWAWGR